MDSEAPPSLTAAAAGLAAGFVQAGLAGDDPLLLTRLMAQLTSLLQAAVSKRQQQYSEWVPLQAYLALLQAHAHFATAGEAVLDEESRQVVQAAQMPHYRYRQHFARCCLTHSVSCMLHLIWVMSLLLYK